MQTRLDRAISIAVGFSAVAIATVFVSREFRRPAATTNALGGTYSETWEEALAIGIETSTAGAPSVVIEFLDLQCPACAHYHRTQIPELRRMLDSARVSYVLVHWPLRKHPEAEAAAIAAECASDQNRFSSFVDVAFQKQREFGRRPWTQFAIDAGVPDTVVFAECLKQEPGRSRVESGRALAEKMQMRGTPGFVVNGYVLARPPTATELVDALRSFKMKSAK